jgi:hypothetical protein
MAQRTTDERFWSKVDKTDGCWFWTAGKASNGYGRFKLNGKPQAAHRVAYELLIGPIPDGMTLDHLCRIRHCVNPMHLEPVTGRENTLRGNNIAARNAHKTHCPNGHEYETRISRSHPNGLRFCRQCRAAVDRVYKRKWRARAAS